MSVVAIHKLVTSAGEFAPGAAVTGLAEGEVEILRAMGAISGEGGGEQAKPAPTFSANPDNPAQVTPAEPTQVDYTVRDKGRGWYVVMQGDREVTKSLREDSVTGFADLTAEDQAAFVAEHAPD